ncbi:hypothetical protein C0J52_26053 [Blattella germanica]|nr:hypothetical protein C0J52_26053 [Blattella germanica]
MAGKKRHGKRTVSSQVSTASSELNESDETTYLSQQIRLEDFEMKLKTMEENLDSILNQKIKALEWEYNVAIKKIPPEILHSKINWNRDQASCSSKKDENEKDCKINRSEHRRLRSSTISSGTSIAQELALKSKPKAKTKFLRSDISHTSIKNAYKTPGCNSTSSIPDIITPKVSGNGPVCIARYPQAGEMAVSLCGSPLMVTPTVNNYKANANVVLPNGRVMSILPESGLRPFNNMPCIDEETRKDLQTLKENINAFINMSLHKQ